MEYQIKYNDSFEPELVKAESDSGLFIFRIDGGVARLAEVRPSDGRVSAFGHEIAFVMDNLTELPEVTETRLERDRDL